MEEEKEQEENKQKGKKVEEEMEEEELGAPKYHLKIDNQSCAKRVLTFSQWFNCSCQMRDGVHVYLPEKCATRTAFPGAEGVKVDAETQDESSGCSGRRPQQVCVSQLQRLTYRISV